MNQELTNNPFHTIPLGIAASFLAGCDPIGGWDYIDKRDGSRLYVEWGPSAPHHLSACATSVERQQVAAPAKEHLVDTNGRPISNSIYRRADFYVCPELAEVIQ